MKIKKHKLESKLLPQSLLNIPDPPKQVYVKGDLSHVMDHKPLLAVVGSRKVSTYGREVTQKLVKGVVNKGVGIVSGLALGVDGVAHTSALEAGGYTIAVMPCGLDKVYPQSHFQLASKITSSGGALVSEYDDGTPPLRQNFIARNRLVAGLADAILVTEAAAKSGTMHTAAFALDQGKTVLAVPGNITSDLSQGTNNLIKSGAIPVTCAEDILLAMGIDHKLTQQEIFGDNPDESIILKLISEGVRDIHELQKQSKLEASKFNQSLGMLEISGKIKSQGGGQWTLG